MTVEICKSGFGLWNSHCVACPPGSYSLSNWKYCRPVPPGHFNPNWESSSYSPCAASIFHGAASCASYSDSTQSCSEGKFRVDEYGCQTAGEGYFSPRGSSMQYLCPEGTYTSKVGSSRCDPCTSESSACSVLSSRELLPEQQSYASPHVLDDTYSYCPAFQKVNTAFGLSGGAICPIRACQGSTVVMSSCEDLNGLCSGDQYFRLYDANGTVLTENDDSTCGYCSAITYEITNPGCETIYLEQGCYGYYGDTCSGRVAVSGGEVIPYHPPVLYQDTDPQQRSALVTFYESTGGPKWLNSTNWNSSLPLYTWYGVKIDNYGNVIQLHLNANNLRGRLSESLLRLTALEELLLEYNMLTGTIWDGVGDLKRMRRLDFTSNSLTGTIPASLHTLSNLFVLSFRANRFEGTFPDVFENMTDIFLLSLRVNSFSGSIPMSIGRLTNLWRLELDANLFSGALPPGAFNAVSISYFDISENRLTGTIPDEMCQIGPGFMNLYTNFMTGVLPTFDRNCFKIKIFDVHDNLLTGRIPISYFESFRLDSLGLYINHFSGAIPSTAKSTFLTEFNAYSNRLTSSIPDSLAKSPYLRNLRLQLNQLTGTLPLSLINTTTLATLDLSYNLFSGNLLGFDFQRLPLLAEVNLQNNLFTGELPTSLCDTGIAKLNVMGNALTCYPVCIQILNVDFIDVLPHCFGDQDIAICAVAKAMNVHSRVFKQLVTLSPIVVESEHPRVVETPSAEPKTTLVSNARVIRYDVTVDPRILSGGGDLKFCLDANCQRLIASYRDQSDWPGLGEIPALKIYSSTFYVVDGGIRSLQRNVWGYKVYIQGYSRGYGWVCSTNPLESHANSTELNYADDACNWFGVTCDYGTTVTELSLKTLGLTGTIPDALSLMSQVLELDFSYNSIDGTLPSTLGGLKSLQGLILGSNRMSGTLPAAILEMKSLQQLSISGNRFHGTIPHFLGEMEKLTVLDLSANSFEGKIPQELCNLVEPPLNASVRFSSNLDLTCFEECWTRNMDSFDSSIGVCAPSSMPTSSPTVRQPKKDTTTGVIVACVVSVAIVAICLFYGISVQRRRQYLDQQQYAGLPIHKAFVYGREITDEMLDESLDTAKLKSREGKTVLNLVMESPLDTGVTSEKILYRLLVDSLPIDVRTGASVAFSDHNDALFMFVKSEDEAVVSVLGRLLSDHWQLVDRLVECKDKHGRTLLNCASPSCKAIIDKNRFLNGLYELRSGLPRHQSQSTIVRLGLYHVFKAPSDLLNPMAIALEPTVVAVKFMKHRYQYIKELSARDATSGSDDLVMEILAHYDGDSNDHFDVQFRTSAIQKGYEEFPYCIVMPNAEKQFKEIAEQYCYGGIQNWDEIRYLTKQIASMLDFLHSNCVVHGDINILSLVKVHTMLKFIDFDASSITSLGELAGVKYSTAVLPPEMYFKKADGSIVVKAAIPTETPEPVELEPTEYECIKADPSQDMWAFGLLVYLLCTGRTLFTCTVNNVISSAEVPSLYEWTDVLKEEKLSVVSDPLARNLLSLVLVKSPSHRLQASQVLLHPFITGKALGRASGEDPEFDVYLSYRTECDLIHAELIYRCLIDAGLRVWWDKAVLRSGERWHDKFFEGMLNSACCVCLLSQDAIANPVEPKFDFQLYESSSPNDMLLLEWQLAFELKERGLLDGVFPVFIGHRQVDLSNNVTYTDYFASGCHPRELPEEPVLAVDKKVREYLNRHALGLPFCLSRKVKDVVGDVTASQGQFLRGDCDSSIRKIASEIVKMTLASREKREYFDDDEEDEYYSEDSDYAV